MELKDLVKKLEEKRIDLRKYSNMIRVTDIKNITDIAEFFKELYNLIVKYHQSLGGLESYLKNLGQYYDLVKNELEEKLKQLEDSYIELECKTIVNGKEVKKKIQINAKFLIEALIEKFGETLWKYLAIRLLPPEIILFIIGCLEDLYNRCTRYEMLSIRMVEFLSTFSATVELFFVRLEEFTKKIEELNKKIEELNTRLSALAEKI